MKNFVSILALFIFGIFSAQCVIRGADQLQVGEKEIYTGGNDGGSCADCFQWSHEDQNVIFESGTRISEVTLKGAVPGKALIKLNLKLPGGSQKCEKVIDVIAPLTSTLIPAPKDCDIKVEGLKEFKRGANNVTFEAGETGNNQSYTWTVTYRSGVTKTSRDKTPQFDFSNNNVITSVALKVTTKNCTRNLSKTYHDNFWYFF